MDGEQTPPLARGEMAERIRACAAKHGYSLQLTKQQRLVVKRRIAHEMGVRMRTVLDALRAAIEPEMVRSPDVEKSLKHRVAVLEKEVALLKKWLDTPRS